jgi:hypothetical protein
MSLLDKVKDAATKATEQAKQGIAAGKEKVEESKLHKQIGEEFEAIGRLVVQQRRGDAPADAVAQVDAAIAKVAELEAQLAEHAADAAAEAGSGDSAPASPE